MQLVQRVDLFVWVCCATLHGDGSEIWGTKVCLAAARQWRGTAISRCGPKQAHCAYARAGGAVAGWGDPLGSAWEDTQQAGGHHQPTTRPARLFSTPAPPLLGVCVVTCRAHESLGRCCCCCCYFCCSWGLWIVYLHRQAGFRGCQRDIRAIRIRNLTGRDSCTSASPARSSRKNTNPRPLARREPTSTRWTTGI